MTPPIISARQVQPLLAARSAGAEAAGTSLDLGRSACTLTLDPAGALLPGGRLLPWSEIEAIAADPDACWSLAGDQPERIHTFSAETQRPYSLLATHSAPSLIVGGFVMHRIKRSDPWTDTANKIRAASPVRGRVLDTTTGLGYTAIQAARTARAVVTIELDPAVLEICRLNPWSAELFSSPAITHIVGDSYDEVEAFEPASFDLVIHDPPSFSLAGELYSGEFYRRLYRLLRPGGRVFHYLGNPESKQGHTVTRGAVRRLKEAGFSRVVPAPEAFGVVAYRPR